MDNHDKMCDIAVAYFKAIFVGDSNVEAQEESNDFEGYHKCSQ